MAAELCKFTKSYWQYPSHNTLHVLTSVEVVASVGTPLPTPSKICRTNSPFRRHSFGLSPTFLPNVGEERLRDEPKESLRTRLPNQQLPTISGSCRVRLPAIKHRILIRRSHGTSCIINRPGDIFRNAHNNINGKNTPKVALRLSKIGKIARKFLKVTLKLLFEKYILLC